MKKTIFGLFAIAALIFASCQKEEIDAITPENEAGTSQIAQTAIPETLTGTIIDDVTRTAYDSDGKFTWLSSDQVRLLVCESLSTYSRQGICTYEVKSLSNEDRTAVFTSKAGDLTDFVDGDWKSTGIAMYPASVLDRFTTPESHSYGTPWFTLARGNVSGLLSDIILTGTNSDAISNYKFSTAMAVLKITLRNIPASACAVKLCTSDKTNYPLDGDFALSKNGDMVEMSFLSTWVSSFKGYQKVDISSEGEIAERSFYFNIPAAEYPANTLSLLIEDANGGMIMKRTIGAKMNIARNECLAIPALSYSYSIAFTTNGGGSVTNPRITWTIDCKRVRFCVSQSPDISLSSFVEGYTFANDNETGNYSGVYNLSGFAGNKPSASGQYYMHYILQSDRGTKPETLSDANVVSYGTIPFYYSSGDVASYVGSYVFTPEIAGNNVYTSNPDNNVLCHPGTGSNYATTMTLQATSDYTKGNIQLSALYGKTCASGHQIYGYYDAGTDTITFPYPGDDESLYFFQAGANDFYIASNSTITNSGQNAMTSTATDDLVFTVNDGGTLTHADYLIMKWTVSSSDHTAWGPFVYGKGFTFTKQ